MKNLVFCIVATMLLMGCALENNEISSEIEQIDNYDLQTKVTTLNNKSEPFQRLRWNKYHFMKNIWNHDKKGADKSQEMWINGHNSWGVKSNHKKGSKINGEYYPIKAYPAILIGDHYGESTKDDPFPKKIKDMGNLPTKWKQKGSGKSFNAAYDIWFDSAKFPGEKLAQNELMIWINYKGSHLLQPIASDYWANGSAKPYDKVKIAGKDFNVYYRKNSERPHQVMTFRISKDQRINDKEFSANIKDFTNYCVQQGWLDEDNDYITSVQAGWEIMVGGTFETKKFSLN